MNIIVNGLGGQHDLDVSASFIQGYESVGGIWTGSIEMRTDSLSNSLLYAKTNGYKMVIRSTTGMSSYITDALLNYPDVLTVMPAGSNSFVLVYAGSIPQTILITGAGDSANETGYNIEFYGPDPIQVEPDASSYSNAYIAGQISYIMDTIPCGHWEARYRAKQTGTENGSWHPTNGYGKININAAIAYTGSIIADPFITGSEIPLGGFSMKYLTPVTISSSLNVIGTASIGTSEISTHNIIGRLDIAGGAITLHDDSAGTTGFVITNNEDGYFAEGSEIVLRAYPSQSNTLTLGVYGQNAQIVPNHAGKAFISRPYGGDIVIGDVTTDSTPFIFNVGSSSFRISGSLNVSGTSFFDGTITASNMLVTNTLTADTFIVNTFTSSSTDVVSGSTKFGSISTDTHQFTGSVYVSGSAIVSGNLSSTATINGREMNLIATNQAVAPFVYLKTYNFTGQVASGIRMFRARGTQQSASQLYPYDTIGNISFYSPYSSEFPNSPIETARITSYFGTSSTVGSDLRFFTSVDADGIGVAEAMIINQDGYVGIGTSAPSYRLHVAGTAYLQSNNKFGDSSGRTHQFTGSVFITGSLLQGFNNIVESQSFAHGAAVTASGMWSHAEGYNTHASGALSHAEGEGTFAIGQTSHAEGVSTFALEEGAHSEGYLTTAGKLYSHAEGHTTIASGAGAHSEGRQTFAKGIYSHAEGRFTTSSGNYSHAQGIGTIAKSYGENVVGTYNTEYETSGTGSFDINDRTFVVGYGSSNSDRKDAVIVYKSGLTQFQNNVEITGSLNITGSVNITGSLTLNGTASRADNGLRAAIVKATMLNFEGFGFIQTLSLPFNELPVTMSIDKIGTGEYRISYSSPWLSNNYIAVEGINSTGGTYYVKPFLETNTKMEIQIYLTADDSQVDLAVGDSATYKFMIYDTI